MRSPIRLQTAAPWAAAVLLLAGCAIHPTPPSVYQTERFETSGKFSRSFPSSPVAICEGARRALLSQGYVVNQPRSTQVGGKKSFQPDRESHVQIEFTIVCAPDDDVGNRGTMFVNAVQDRYTLKRTSNSASVGVGPVGSVSLPFSSSDDSLVKVASETIPAGAFYERFFNLVDRYVTPGPSN